MDDRTARALNAINRAFYRDHAGEFEATRSAPWPGWTHLAEWLAARDWGGVLRVLDVGCGNARFAAFLADSASLRSNAIDYVGIDASAALLATARARRLPFPARLHHADFVEDSDTALPPGAFSLIALFGVLHHVPGRARRAALLGKLARRLAPGGALVLASWQFEAFERFTSKLVSWESYNLTATEPVDTMELEPGDHLLPWGRGQDALRYCHFTDESDTRLLLQSQSLSVADTWAADGREGNLNRYFICHFSNTQIGPKEGAKGP